eukprot:446839-Alexandrium_andersonii.AAC.1
MAGTSDSLECAPRASACAVQVLRRGRMLGRADELRWHRVMCAPVGCMLLALGLRVHGALRTVILGNTASSTLPSRARRAFSV